MPLGSVALVLHAHLPFVKHPEYEDFLEEDWYFEAVTETYLPLLEMMEGLVDDHVPFALTIDLSPTLASMMEDSHHVSRMKRYLDRSMDLARREIVRLQGDRELEPVARFYLDRLERLGRNFTDRYGGNLLAAFRRLMDVSGLELMTCAATHGLLPALRRNPSAVRAQVRIGAQEYERHFGRRSKGIWLPECGYYEGVEDFLADEGIRYFLVDSHCLRYAAPTPLHGVYAPVFTPRGVAAFGRDAESSKQVWSAEEGYPGDSFYREFYRDQGYDLPIDLVRDFVQPTGHRKQTGLKYYRITGDVKLDEKAPYIPGAARERAAEHAGNFLFNREKQIQHLASELGRPPLVVAPYDAELFGHWWFEGPDFLGFLFRKAALDQDTLDFTNLSSYLEVSPTQQVCAPASGSWGDKGYFEVWVNESNDYIYRHLFHAADDMTRLCGEYPQAEGVLRRALNQCARELLLAQSSDWPFIITMDTMVDYAHRRVREHVLRFLRLADQIRRDDVDEGWLGTLEMRDSPFPDIDYRIYAGGT